MFNYLESAKYKICHFFTVDDLKYLERGGRISKTTATLGSLIQIKPILKIDNEGRIVQDRKVISRKKSINSIADLSLKVIDENYPYCFIAHANCIKDALLMKEKIEAGSSVKPVITNLGPVIGSHSGPGTLAVFFVGKSDR